MKNKSTKIAKGDTMKIKEAIKEAILNSQINKPKKVEEEVDKNLLNYMKRLKRFHFNNTFLNDFENKNKNILEQKAKNQLIIKTNDKYSQIYSKNVIIPLADLTKILEKYDLYSAPTRLYSKLIPQKNLLDIEEFWNKYSKNKYGFGKFDLRNLEKLTIHNSISELEYKPLWKSDRIDTSVLQIIAPLNEFNLSSTEKIIGNFIIYNNEWDEKNIKKPEPINRDPIIWMPLKYPTIGGAALIITQWGPEADLPEFKKMNKNCLDKIRKYKISSKKTDDDKLFIQLLKQYGEKFTDGQLNSQIVGYWCFKNDIWQYKIYINNNKNTISVNEFENLLKKCF